MSIKIKVNLPYDVYNCLLNDMELFNFKKKDGSINKNSFINTLFKNYHKIFLDHEKDLESKIKNITSDKENVYKIISLINESNYEDYYYYDYDLQFILNKENEQYFEMIEKYYLKERTISKYFRDMFISYVSKSQYKRESIIYEPIYSKLDEAIKKKKRIIMTDINKESTIIDPFDIDTTKEELYNYLVGVAVRKDKREIKTIRLYKIALVNITLEDIEITHDEIELLSSTITHGAQFVMESTKNYSIVRLTNKGIKLFNEIYLNRPHPVKIEKNEYFFDCSYTQLEVYFFKFGYEALIVKPYDLRKKITNKYQKALRLYQGKQS